MKNKDKIVISILTIIILITGYCICQQIRNKSIEGKETSFLATTVKEADVSLVVNGEKQPITDVQTLLLSNGNTLYFGIPNDDKLSSGAYCGSGGCQYDFYVGESLTKMKKVLGFDSYSLDCNTNKVSFIKDTNGEVFGFPKIDKDNKIIKIYTHLSAQLGDENIYHIEDNGSPTLIASYDHTCSDKTVTLFHDNNFSKNLTDF